jgi:cellobiose phosphorylase
MAFAALGDSKRTWELLQLINPLNYGKDAATIARYKVEPYIIAADVYAEPLHKGRGGWTWYTGSAGWMYQLLTESFIGIKRNADKLYFTPCIPKEWTSVKVQYRYMETLYRIEIIQSNQNNSAHILVDGNEMNSDFISLVNDKIDHEVKITIGITEKVNEMTTSI